MATTGCRSVPVAYQFRPAARAVTEPAALPATSSLPATIPAPASARPLPAQKTTAAPTQPTRRRGVQHQLARLARVGTPLTLAGAPATQAARARTASPRGAQEVGLGTTVLGVLGLVVLPISLIGLALSGGGIVWGVLAAAAALAVLVAYLDPFG